MHRDPYDPPSDHPKGPPFAPPIRHQELPTANIVESLRGTRPWMLLMAILGFLGAGLMFLGGLFVIMAASLGSAASQGETPIGFFWAFGLIYLVAAGWYVFVSVVLVRGFSSMGRVIDGGGIAELEDAIDKQRVFWKTLGISVIAGMILAVLAMIGVAVAAVFSGLST